MIDTAALQSRSHAIGVDLGGTRIKLVAVTPGGDELLRRSEPTGDEAGVWAASRAGPALFEPLSRYLEEYEWRPTGAAVPVVAATLGEFAGALGAARNAIITGTR